MSDIGKDDVVEATQNIRRYSGDVIIPVKSRATVLEVTLTDPAWTQHCGECGGAFPFGLHLVEFPVEHPGLWWCGCAWRKVGGSQSDTVRRFAEDLNVKQPRRAKERV